MAFAAAIGHRIRFAVVTTLAFVHSLLIVAAKTETEVQFSAVAIVGLVNQLSGAAAVEDGTECQYVVEPEAELAYPFVGTAAEFEAAWQSVRTVAAAAAAVVLRAGSEAAGKGYCRILFPEFAKVDSEFGNC